MYFSSGMYNSVCPTIWFMPGIGLNSYIQSNHVIPPTDCLHPLTAPASNQG